MYITCITVGLNVNPGSPADPWKDLWPFFNIPTDDHQRAALALLGEHRWDLLHPTSTLCFFGGPEAQRSGVWGSPRTQLWLPRSVSIATS